MTDDRNLGPVARRLSATRRVLCIEDEPDISAFLRAYFRASGYDLVALDPDDADQVLAALDEHEPDLVLLDIRLRGFSGHDAYRRMRADERWAFTPVIVVSASADAYPDFESPQGLDAFMAKPFNTNVLAEMVEDRITRAEELAAVGRSDTLELFNQEYLRARIADEMALTGADGSFSLALVRLRSVDTVRAEVGESGLGFLARTLVHRSRAALPDDAIIGITESAEIAVLLPALSSADARAALRPVLRDVAGEFAFAGGATVPVVLAAGLASYPANAADADGLFMAADAALESAVEDDALLSAAL